MVKKAKTPESVEEAKYYTCWKPYPNNADFELSSDYIPFARWIANILGDPTGSPLHAIYYKPRNGMVIFAIDKTFPRPERLLGEHRWSEFLKKPPKGETELSSRIFYSRYATEREVQKDGWKCIFVEEYFFANWGIDKWFTKVPYPAPHWCSTPPENKAEKTLCRPLPVAQVPKPIGAPTSAPAPRPVVGSTGWAQARQESANNKQSGAVNGKGPQQKQPQTARKGSKKQPSLGPGTFPALDSKPQVKKVIPGLSQPPASPVQSAWGNRSPVKSTPPAGDPVPSPSPLSPPPTSTAHEVWGTKPSTSQREGSTAPAPSPSSPVLKPLSPAPSSSSVPAKKQQPAAKTNNTKANQSQPTKNTQNVKNAKSNEARKNTNSTKNAKEAPARTPPAAGKLKKSSSSSSSPESDDSAEYAQNFKNPKSNEASKNTKPTKNAKEAPARTPRAAGKLRKLGSSSSSPESDGSSTASQVSSAPSSPSYANPAAGLATFNKQIDLNDYDPNDDYDEEITEETYHETWETASVCEPPPKSPTVSFGGGNMAKGKGRGKAVVSVTAAEEEEEEEVKQQVENLWTNWTPAPRPTGSASAAEARAEKDKTVVLCPVHKGKCKPGICVEHKKATRRHKEEEKQRARMERRKQEMEEEKQKKEEEKRQKEEEEKRKKEEEEKRKKEEEEELKRRTEAEKEKEPISAWTKGGPAEQSGKKMWGDENQDDDDSDIGDVPDFSHGGGSKAARMYYSDEEYMD